MNEEILVPALFFACLFGIVYLYLTTRNKERLALIEKGASADMFSKPAREGTWTLKIGIMAIGVGLGIVTANILATAGALREEVAFPSMIFLFAGIGLVASYYIAIKRKEENN